MEDGLPQYSVVALAQTPDGYLWIGTANGLARFDGVKFSIFDKTNTPQLRDSGVAALRTDRAGRLWIGTAAGVTLYRDGRFQALGAAEGLPVTPVWALYQSRAGDMWVGFAGAVYQQQGRGFRERKIPITGNVLSLAETGEGVWAATDGGLLRFTDGTPTLFTRAQGLPDNNVLSVALAGDDLWIGTARGVIRRRGGRFYDDAPGQLRGEEVWATLLDREQTLWFGTRHGLLRVRGTSVERFTSKEGLSHDYINTLLEDRKGSLWIGTQLAGLNQLQGGAFTTYSTAEGLGADVVWSIFDDPRAGIWIGTEGGGLSLLSGGRLTNIDLPSKTVTSIARGSDGTLWVGTWDHGLLRSRDGRWTAITKRDGLADDTVTSLEVVGATLWVGTAHGLSRFEVGRISNFGTRDGLRGEYVVVTHHDRRGRLWVGTDGGLCRLDGSRFMATVGKKSIPKGAAYCIHEDGDGVLRIGTRHGLWSIGPDDSFRIMTSREGVLQDTVWHIEQDRDGDFWLATNGGVYRVTRSSLRKGRIVDPLLLGVSDGMKSAESTIGTYPSSWSAADGSIWFPTVRGAARLDPAAAKRRAAPPLLRIEEVIVDGRRHSETGTLDLHPGTDNLEIHYTAPEFIAPERLHFRYRLEGYDPGWIDAGSRRVAYYTHLPHGHYQFRVIGAGGGGEREVSLPLLVRPRFSETIWFNLLCLAGAGIAIALLYRLRVRSVQARYSAVLAERNRIAREFHDTLAQGLVALRLQLDGAIGARDSGDSSRALQLARTMATQCLADTRRSLFDLRADALDNSGLVGAVHDIAGQAGRDGGPEVTAHIVGVPYRLDDRVEQNILRVAQEAVANAVRHSGATTVEVTLVFTERDVEIVIADNGSGPPAGEHFPPRLGLIGIAERAKELRANLAITGRPGEGTTVRLIVPLRRRWPFLQAKRRAPHGDGADA
jgi:ligand-binding sensor domain-containing protein/signal transduction histidine kinase